MNDIYKDIASRTDGEILIGVVGPVRSGKSTFISKFMEKLVIPNITSDGKRRIAVDELPQSAQGKTIMTTEPKFVPADAVTVKLDNVKAKIRLIDCVGYMVDGAVGHEENGQPRLVKTPWQDEEMPFEKAGEFGTHKVIEDHSTIGIVVTSDGSFSEIDRAAYQKAEERVVNELKSINKPFIVLFNTVDPDSESAKDTVKNLQKKYGVQVMATNVTALDENKIGEIFLKVLMEFPIRVVNFDLPKWIKALPTDNPVVSKAISCIRAGTANLDKMSAYKSIEDVFSGSETFGSATYTDLDMGEGSATVGFEAEDGLLYKVLSDECGAQLLDDLALLLYVRQLKVAKEGYSKIRSALEECSSIGYGVVPAVMTDAAIDEPEVVKKGGQYSVRIRVGAGSVHLIRADVRSDVEVISGTKEQCEGFVEKLTADGGEGLETEVFGRSVRSSLEESLVAKSTSLTESVRSRLKRTVNKAVNEKKNNLICILI